MEGHMDSPERLSWTRRSFVRRRGVRVGTPATHPRDDSGVDKEDVRNGGTTRSVPPRPTSHPHLSVSSQGAGEG